MQMDETIKALQGKSFLKSADLLEDEFQID